MDALTVAVFALGLIAVLAAIGLLAVLGALGYVVFFRGPRAEFDESGIGG